MKEINFGKISIYVGENIIYEVDILSKNSIAKKDMWDYLKELIQALPLTEDHFFIKNHNEFFR